MAHNPQWLVNKHPGNLKAQIRELVQYGYVIAMQDATTAQLTRKKHFSCLIAILALLCGFFPVFLYLFYFLAKRDDIVYLDIETQTPEQGGKTIPGFGAVDMDAKTVLKWIGIAFLAMMTLVAVSGFISAMASS